MSILENSLQDNNELIIKEIDPDQKIQNSDDIIKNYSREIEYLVTDLNNIKLEIQNFKNGEFLHEFFAANIKDIFDKEKKDNNTWNILQSKLKKIDFKIELGDIKTKDIIKDIDIQEFYTLNERYNNIVQRLKELKIILNNILNEQYPEIEIEILQIIKNNKTDDQMYQLKESLKNVDLEIKLSLLENEIIKQNIPDPSNLLKYKNQINQFKSEILELNKQENQIIAKKIFINENFNAFELIQKLEKYQEQIQELVYQNLKLEQKIQNLIIPNHTKKLQEFNITNITYVKDFIVNYLEPIISPIINETHFDAKINKDYTIKIMNLEENDILQDKNLIILVKSLNTINMNDELKFNIKINYRYDLKIYNEVLDAIFKPAISKEFWKNRNNSYYENIVWLATTYEKVSEDIKTAKPLQWFLNEPHLNIKLFSELSAASDWTTFYWHWWAMKKNYDEPGGVWAVSDYSAIPNEGKNLSIRYIKDLFKFDNTYFNKLFLIIEEKLNNLNIKCKVKKKTVKYSNNSDDFVFGLGLLDFNSSNHKSGYKQYYIALNFDVVFENNATREYAGVVFSLSDELKLYG